MWRYKIYVKKNECILILGVQIVTMTMTMMMMMMMITIVSRRYRSFAGTAEVTFRFVLSNSVGSTSIDYYYNYYYYYY